RIAAGPGAGPPDLGEPVLQGRNISQLAEMKLDVLARGHVAKAARVFFGALAEHLQMVGGQDPLWDLDPLHADVRLALAVGPARKAKLFKLIGRPLPGLELADRVDQVLDLARARVIEQVVERKLLLGWHVYEHGDWPKGCQANFCSFLTDKQ